MTGYFIPGAAKAAGDGAHIVAENERGPRGQSSLTPAERAEAHNGVWLCPTCHRIVDIVRPQDYSIELLQDWKLGAKQWWQNSQGLPLQTAARPRERQQAARPSPESLRGARNFLMFHEPLANVLAQLRWQSPMPFERDIVLPENAETQIMRRAENRGIGSSWESEWSSTYNCDDKELLDCMVRLVSSANAIRRPFGNYKERRVKFNPPDAFAQAIKSYMDSWNLLSERLQNYEKWGL